MKKVLSFVAATALVLSLTACGAKTADLKVGQVQYAAHGTKSFAVATVVMDGDKISVAHVDEYQFLAAGNVLVPNSDSDFGANYADPAMGLASKRANADSYSALMKEKAGSTVDIVSNFEAIQNYAEGKTIAELETAIKGKTSQEVLDAVSGATLVDTVGYLESIIAAAKVAK